MIEIKKASYDYVIRDENDNIESSVRAVDNVSLMINEGDFVVVLGRNGSGKSTLARMINGLLKPAAGSVIVDGEEPGIENKTFVGMVFQNPDNQIVSNVVEEDVAFGPENLGVPTEEIRARVDEACKRVGMTDHMLKSPNALSGGQKQRVAIAGVLAMKSKYIVLDEPTAMLDPIGRKDVINTIKDLNKNEGITIVLITHFMEEAVDADKVYVMDEGKIKMEGTPHEIFAKAAELKALGLTVPQVTELADKLGIKGVITTEELISELKGRKS